jgi:hypothetical protein
LGEFGWARRGTLAVEAVEELLGHDRLNPEANLLLEHQMGCLARSGDI